SARPDMCRFDGGAPRVLIENKFWAGLTENQPVEYLRRLAGYPNPAVLQGLLGQEPKKKGLQDKVDEVPNLPRVLIIGDSISIGCTPPLRKLLKDKANVHHNAGNAADTASGVAKLKT